MGSVTELAAKASGHDFQKSETIAAALDVTSKPEASFENEPARKLGVTQR
jgi:hypothetical protein